MKEKNDLTYLKQNPLIDCMTDEFEIENLIHTFLHCPKCYVELKNAKTEVDYALIEADPVKGESHCSFARFEVGWTDNGFQVWCTRHNLNIIHIDFDNTDALKKAEKEAKANSL